MSAHLIRPYRRDGLRHALFLAAIVAVFMLCVLLVGGIETLLALGAITAVFAFLASPRIDPRYFMKINNARPVSASDPLCNIVRLLSQRARLPQVPKLFLSYGNTPNAVAYGDRDGAAIAITTACLGLLNTRELTAVLAHEIAHIANGDSRRRLMLDFVRQMTGVTAIVGLGVLAGLWWNVPGFDVSLWFPATLLVGPAAVFVLQRALERASEHLADARAAELTGDPQALASALAKIHWSTQPLLARIFGARAVDVLPPFLHTHPLIEERLQRLRAACPPNERSPRKAARLYRPIRVSRRHPRIVVHGSGALNRRI